MKRFKSAILALVMVMGIGMVKPAEAYAIPTATTCDTWLRDPSGKNGKMVPAGRWYSPVAYLYNDWVAVADFMSGKLVGSIYVGNLEHNYVVTHGANLRSEPKVADNIIGFVPKGSTTIVTDDRGNRYWAQVMWNGKVGYVSRQYVDPLHEFLPS